MNYLENREIEGVCPKETLIKLREMIWGRDVSAAAPFDPYSHMCIAFRKRDLIIFPAG